MRYNIQLRKMAKKILIIDDNSLTREINGSVLEHAGYEVIAAGGGSEGLKKLTEEKIDLIVLDLIMPEVNGFEFLKICKNDPSLQHIPIIVLTGRDLPEEIEKVKSLGARECLVKHKVHPSNLLESIKMIL